MISQQQQLSQHHIFHMPASHANRRGEGLLIAVSNHLPYSATQWKKDTVNQIIWVTLTASSPQLPTLTIGACYIPPATSAQLQLSSVSDRFDTLTRHLRAATVASGHVILAGDFNAKVGNISDSWVTCFGDIPPHRLPTDPPQHNQHGTHLMQMCEDTSMVLCTDRTLSDVPALPSFPRASSWLDHALVSPNLFPLIHSCGVQPHRRDSDHSPLVLTLHIPCTLLQSPIQPPSTTSTPLSTYKWDPSKRNAWSCALQSPPRQQHLQLSADANSAQQANKHLHSALMAAAKLIKLRKSMPSTNNLPQQSQSPCFDHECKLLRHQWQQAENRHPGAQATILLLAQLQHIMSRKRRQYNGHQIMQFSQLLKSGPRKFWQKARTPLSLLPAQLQSPAAWEPYLTHLTAPAPHSATHMPPPSPTPTTTCTPPQPPLHHRRSPTWPSSPPQWQIWRPPRLHLRGSSLQPSHSHCRQPGAPPPTHPLPSEALQLGIQHRPSACRVADITCHPHLQAW